LNRLTLYRWHDFFWLAGLALIYALLGYVVLTHFSTSDGVSLVWPANGLALAVLLLGDRKYWPGIFVGAYAANLLAGKSALACAILATGNTVEVLVAFWLLTHFINSKYLYRFDPRLPHPRDCLWLTLAAVSSPIANIALVIPALLATGLLAAQNVGQNIHLWWQANMLGMLLLTPFILVWRHPPRSWFNGLRAIETLACFGLAFIFGQVVFLGWHPTAFSHYHKSFLMFIFVAWSAVRYSRRGVLLVILVSAVQGMLSAVLNVGYFANDMAQTGMSVFSAYTITLTLVGMALALTINDRKRVIRELDSARQGFSDILENVDAHIYLKGADGRYLFANRRVRELWGASMEEIVGFGDEKFFDAETAANIQRNDHCVLVDGETIRLEETDTTMSGQSNIYWTVKLPLKRDDGSIYALCGISTDITERKLVEDQIRHTSHYTRSLIEASLDPLVTISLEGKITDVNSATEQVTGLTREELIGTDFSDYFTEPDKAREAYQIAFSQGSVTDFPLAIRHRDKHVTDVLYNASVYRNEANEVLGVFAAARDITASKKAQEELKMAGLVYQHSGEAMFVTDAYNRVIAINPAFSEITGYSESEVIGKNPALLNSGHHDDVFFETMWKSLKTTGQWQGEIWNRKKNGEVYAEWLTINSINDENGKTQRYLALFSDITEKKQSAELIWKQANFDPLTNLPNRRLFQDRLELDIKKASRTNGQLALLFIDLDRFKEVNDSLGHHLGDELLMEAAKRISACVRDSDTVARFGGDEFTVILGELPDVNRIERVAMNILESLGRYYRLKKEMVFLTASMGITLYPMDANNSDDLLKNADQAMYVAKSEGRNRYSYFTKAMQESSTNRHHLNQDMHEALSAGQFRLHYQPILDMRTGEVFKAEALLRWQHPVRGMIGPMEFIPVAEDNGLIKDIGDWVFKEAAHQAKTWSELTGRPFVISVNKSPMQFLNPHCNDEWLTYLHQIGMTGENIVAEITEGVLLKDNHEVSKVLLKFRDAGIKVAIDDFGTGYSSLSYLKKFDIDYLKIDQSFTRNLAPDSSDLALSEAIIVMAHKLGMQVIAEGIETAEQRDLLVAAGCDFGQGFLFSRPVPAEEFEQLLKTGLIKAS